MRKLEESEKDEIKEILVEKLGVEFEKIHDESKLNDELGADSLDLLDIILDIETKFDISIQDDEYNNHLKVEDLYAIVERLIN